MSAVPPSVFSVDCNSTGGPLRDVRVGEGAALEINVPARRDHRPRLG